MLSFMSQGAVRFGRGTSAQAGRSVDTNAIVWCRNPTTGAVSYQPARLVKLHKREKTAMRMCAGQ